MNSPLRVALVLGTRPEAVKLLPVIRAMRQDARFAPRVCATGQHREMLDQILGGFGVLPDVDLDLMQPGQTLNEIVARAIPRLDALYEAERPDLVLVQGDTTSAYCAALAAFHRRIPVAHLEAGLRSHDRFHPYPEEANRRMTSAVTDLHLAPTPGAAENLVREGVPRADVVITGNTVVDALLLLLSTRPPPPPGRPTVLVTLHRREGWEAADAGRAPLEEMLEAIRDASNVHASIEFVFPVHLNPRVREPVHRVLGAVPNVRLIPPVPYVEFVELMAQATAILTDSGGIQEEAPSLGVPVLVLRRTTERPEGVRAGTSRLVGTSAARIRAELAAVLAEPRAERALPCPNPFGDGHASARVLDAILWKLAGGGAPVEFVPPPHESAGD